jgi:hypothetical protein
MATNFFSEYPKISYSLDDFESRQVVVDIFKRVVLSKEYLENSLYFEEYEVLHGETPEEVSYRFYGTSKLHWTILMFNNIVDPRFEWPVSEESLYKIVEKKYGGPENVFTTNRAKNSKGYVVETFFILTEDSTHEEPIRLLFENPLNEGVNTPIAYQDSLEITDLESNYEVESERNEKNRAIKVLKPEIIQEIVSNYKKLINI